MAWPPGTHQDVTDEVTSLRDGKGWAATLGGRQRITEPARPTPLLWVVGRYYVGHLTPGTGTATPVASELRLLPFYVSTPRAIDRLGCNVSTAGSAGHVARLGIYNADPNTGLPTTVIIDAGSVAVDTTGVKEVVVSVTLHGLHWVGLTTQSGTFTIVATASTVAVAGSPTVGGATSNALVYPSVSPTSALPDRTGVTPTHGTLGMPAVYMRGA